MNDERLWISAKQAAGALGVSVPTLYAYVSRKLIRSRSVQGSRRRRYWKADIDRLSDEQPAGEQSNVALGLINETKITLLTEQGLYYPGRNLFGLAETESFEAVASLLWEADVRATFTQQVPPVPPSYPELKRTLANATCPYQCHDALPL